MRAPSPFDLDQPALYARWRAAKLASHPRRAEELIVDVADPRALSAAERRPCWRCARAPIWRSTAAR